MRASWLPIVGVIVTSCAAAALIRTGDGSGAGGPDYTSGVLRLVVGERHQTASAAVPVAVTVAAVPVDPASWRVVVVAAEDRHPFTRALALGLAERITAGGGVAIRDAVPEPHTPVPPVPLAADRHLSLAWVSGEPPESAGGAATARLRLTLHRVGPPAGHAAERLAAPVLPDATPVEVELRIDALAGVRWAGWYAGVGRTAADQVLAALGHRPAGEERSRHAAWPDGALRQPPMASHVRWDHCFDELLVRGFVGRIDGRTAQARDGSDEPSDAALRRLLKRGEWQPAGEGLWQRRNELVSIAPAAMGFTVVNWQERPSAIAAVETWLTEAQAGDAAARRRCQALVRVPYLPQELRDRLAAVR